MGADGGADACDHDLAVQMWKAFFDQVGDESGVRIAGGL